MDESRHLEVAHRAVAELLEEDAQDASQPVKMALEQIREHVFKPGFGEAELLRLLAAGVREVVTRDFDLEIGETLEQYIRIVRLVGTIQLIGKTGLPFERIADLSGWDTAAALGKACRKLHGGRSPGDLRVKAQRDYPELCFAPGPNESESLSAEDRERFARRLAQKLGEWLTPDKLELLASGDLECDPLVFSLMKSESN